MVLRALCFVAPLLVASQVLAEDATLKTRRDRSSYALGVNLIGNLKQQGLEIDLDVVVKGMKDAHAGGKLLMSDEEIRNSTKLYQNEVRNNQAASRALAAVENKKNGAAFLAQNAVMEGVVTLPSGLQYLVVKAGDGKRPTDADTVEFHYRGALANGSEFESSYRLKKPVLRKVKGGVVPGLSEALKLMPVGSTWRLFIPAQLAYGERGSAGVGPNQTVIFEVELLAVK